VPITDEEIITKATAQAKAMKKKFAKAMIDHLPEEESAVSVFMAGSPGAGKTETAKVIISQFKQKHGVEVVHIENDELRKEFADYNGVNSPLFQRPATLLVEAIHDRALKQKVSFLLDSTLSSLDKAKSNIERSLKKGRYVLIIFVYQDPEQAWLLVKAREIVEGRRVPAEVFVNQFLDSQRVLSELRKIFTNQIDIIFMEKILMAQKKNLILT
jgi:UDP-N-acetylglucosamine kinase